VVEPDGSWRPSVETEAEGLARTGPLYPEEEALRAAVSEKLSAANIHVSVDVEGNRVILHGKVGDPAAIGLLQAIVESVPGVAEVENRLVVS